MLRWNSSQSSHIMQQETKLSLWDSVKTKFLNFLKAQITAYASLSIVDMADWVVVGKVDVNMAMCHAQALCMTHLHAQWTNERRRAPRLHPSNSSVLIRQVNVHSKWPPLLSVALWLLISFTVRWWLGCLMWYRNDKPPRFFPYCTM